MSLPISTKNQFKETARYLQDKLSGIAGSQIRYSMAQEMLSRLMGFKDYHGYQHWLQMAQEEPIKAKWANGCIQQEIASLRFCLETAQGGYSTAIRMRKILLHLYNKRWLCDLDMTNYDSEHTIHMCNVIALASRANNELHNYIEGSQDKYFRPWAEQALKDEWWESLDIKHRFSDITDRHYSSSNQIQRDINNMISWANLEGVDTRVFQNKESVSLILTDKRNGFEAEIEFFYEEEDEGLYISSKEIDITELK